MGAFIDEKKGTIHGYWKVIGFDKIDSHHDARWRCKCLLCGRIVSVRGFSLRNGRSTKCVACARKERN